MKSYVVYRMAWPDGSSYVGMSADLGARLSKHRSGFKTKTHHCGAALKKFLEFGFPKVEVLAFTKSAYEARKLEKKHIRLCRSVNWDGTTHINIKERQRAFFGRRR